MQKTEVDSFAKLDLLETKIGQTVQKLSQLTTQHDELKKINEELLEDMENLRNRNKDLTNRINSLEVEIETRAKKDGSKEQIIKRIDKMLEKFGELQI
ncbi:MAG: hypothetical protein JSW50_08450 [Candidatus Latescibacterota bacterium]|nr:MAG: hypothetical protein JSW50_08450 [Candidatus Latescibacterota bacterium]